MLFLLPFIYDKTWFPNCDLDFEKTNDLIRKYIRKPEVKNGDEGAHSNESLQITAAEFTEIIQFVRNNRINMKIPKNTVDFSNTSTTAAVAIKKTLQLDVICNGVNCAHVFESHRAGDDQFWCYSCKTHYCCKCITGCESVSDILNSKKYGKNKQAANYNFCCGCRNDNVCVR